MNPVEIAGLYEYNAWADRRVLEAAGALSPDQFAKPLSSSFPSIQDTLVHVHSAEWVWLERFQGRSPSAFPDPKEFTDYAVLKTRWTALEPALLNFVRGLSQQDLDRELEYKTFKFGTYRNPLWQSMLHVVNHGSYHRGQVTTMLRQLGAQPVATDLMHFYRERATAAAV
jgi:uncharacterized damage-inducible protein DinB